MRKTIHVIFLLIVSVAWAQAQTLIPRVGLTISSLATEEIDNGITAETNNNTNTGFTFGVGYNMPVSTLGKVMLSLQPELNYIQKGFKGTSTGEFNIGEQVFQFHAKNEHTINYLEIPVLARFEYGGDKFKVHVHAGPSVGFGLGGKYKSESTVDTGETVEVYKSEGKIRFYEANEEDVMSFDHNVDFGWQGGAGVTFMNRITLDVRYGMSLTDLHHDAKTKNRVAQFTVGVPLSLN
jgi:hypothetical protein